MRHWTRTLWETAGGVVFLAAVGVGPPLLFLHALSATLLHVGPVGPA